MGKFKETVNGILGLIIIGAGISWWWSCSSDNTRDEQKNVVITQTSPKKEVKLLSEQSKELAISGIKEYSEVLDAAITQDGEDINLVIVVRPSTNLETAKERADDFLRMTMSNSFGVELSPAGKEVGPTNFNYAIGIYHPDETEVEMGVKQPSSPYIYW